MTDIGELVIRIKADAAQLEAEMRKANGVVKSNAGEMGGAFKTLKEQIKELIPAITIGSIVEFTKNALEAAGKLQELSERTGLAASTFSALNIPLIQAGTNVDDFAQSMIRLNDMIGQAAKGTNQEAVKAFDALGLSVKKLLDLSPDQRFVAIADALSKFKDQGKLTEGGANLLGKQFALLIPLLLQASGNMGAFIEKQKQLNGTLSDDDIKKINDFGNAWTAEIERIKLKLVEGVLAFDDFMKKGREVGNSMPSFADRSAQGIDHFGNKIPGFESWEDKSKRLGMVTEATFMPPKAAGAGGNNNDLLTPPKDSQLKEYIADLQAETTAIGESERAMFIARAEIEATAKAKEDFNNKLRASKTLLPEEKAQVDQLAGTFYDLKKAQEEVARFQQVLHDKLSSTLTDIVFKAGNAKQAMLDFAESIAKAAFERRIAGPLADALIGTGGGGGLLDGVFKSAGGLFGGFFAAGGSPQPGVPYVVGEKGPELRIDGPGTIIPNHAIGGGTTVIVQQTINMSPGLPETVNAAIRSAAPQIAAQAQAAVFAEMKRGGPASRITGLRN